MVAFDYLVLIQVPVLKKDLSDMMDLPVLMVFDCLDLVEKVCWVSEGDMMVQLVLLVDLVCQVWPVFLVEMETQVLREYSFLVGLDTPEMERLSLVAGDSLVVEDNLVVGDNLVVEDDLVVEDHLVVEENLVVEDNLVVEENLVVPEVKVAMVYLILVDWDSSVWMVCNLDN